MRATARIATIIPALLLLFGCGNQQTSFRGAEGQQTPREEEASQGDAKQKQGSINDKGQKDGQDEVSPTDSPQSVEKKQTSSTKEAEGPLSSNEFRFQSSKTMDDSLTAKAEPGLVEDQITLEADYQAASMTFDQIDRQKITNTFEQGTSGDDMTETFSQNELGILDVLVVVDNSGSMHEEQQGLSDKLDPLLSAVSETDWQIGVVTTDPADGCSPTLISKGDSDASTAFANAVQAGTSGTGYEQGIRMAVEGLSCDQTDWVRQNSTVAVLMVSDEDNCSSNGMHCSGEAWDNEDYLLNHFTQNMGRTLGESAKFYGLFWHPSETCSTAYNRAYQYRDAVNRTGGTYGSICDSDYTSTLEAISSDINTVLEDQFQLAHEPDAGTLDVYVNGNLVTSGYTLNGDLLTFDPPPPEGAMIEAQYTVGATPIYKRFSLSQAPAEGTLSVKINGQNVSDGYAVDRNTNELVFDTKPADGATIKAMYREDKDLLDSFSIGSNAKDGSITVKVDGDETDGFSYDQAGGMIVLDQAPSDGSQIEVSFTERLGPILSYDLSVMGANPHDFQANDASSGDAVDITYENGSVSVKDADFAEGRTLDIRYRNDSSGKFSVELPREPAADSFSLEGAPEGCTVGSGITIDGKTVNFDCKFAEASDLKLSFSYKTEPKVTYEVNEAQNPGKGRWEVYVDGEMTDDFERDGTTITLGTKPPPETPIKIVHLSRAS